MRQVLQEGLEVYIHQARREGKQGSVSVDPLANMVEPSETFRLVQAFFDSNQPRHALGFLHRDSVLAQLAAGQAPTTLIQMLAALSLIYSSRAPPDRARADQWAEAVRTAVFTSRSDDAFSTSRLGLILLLKVYDEVRGNHGDSWLLTGLAVRMAVGLQLNKEGTRQMSEGEREIKRRLMWSCFLADRMFGAGQADFTVCQTSNISIRLPRRMSDLTGPSALPLIQEVLDGRSLDDVRRHGEPLSFHVWLIEIRHRALLYAKNLDESSVLPWQLASPYHALLGNLTCWRTTFDLAVKHESSTFEHGASELLAQYHQIHSDLQRLAMPGFQESLPLSLTPLAPPAWISETRQQCVDHALALCEILRQKIERTGLHSFVDRSIVVFVYEAMRIQLQYISMSETKLEGAIRQVLIENFSTGLGIVTYMGEAFEELRPSVKVIRSLLSRHGVPIGPEQVDDDAESTDDNDGRVLSKMHYLRLLRRPPTQDDFPYPAPTVVSPARSSITSQARSAPKPDGTGAASPDASQRALSALYEPPSVVSTTAADQSFADRNDALDVSSWNTFEDGKYATADPLFWTLEDWTASAS